MEPKNQDTKEMQRIAGRTRQWFQPDDDGHGEKDAGFILVFNGEADEH